MILTTGCNDWQDGMDVVVEGEARRVADEARLRRPAHAWAKKRDGSWQFEVGNGVFQHDGGDGEGLVFEVAPAKVLSFSKDTGAATRHRFVTK